MRLPVCVLVSLVQLANCLPIVDPGLFVILGVRSCRAGTGYCLLGLDCTLDEDFLPDDQGGHCDGLRSAFTPSAHFICCRYSAANGTIPPESLPLPTPINMGQDVAENGLAPLSDYFNTDIVGTNAEDYGTNNSHESDESNLVQGAVATVASLETADDIPTEPSTAYWSPVSSNGSEETAGAAVGAVASSETADDGRIQPAQAYWSSLPNNGSSEAEDSSTVAVGTVSDAMYGEFSVAETTGFTGYTIDMSEVITTGQNGEEATRVEYSDITMSEEETTGTTITETSVTEFTTQRQDEISSTDSGVNQFSDNATSEISGISDRRDASSSKLRPIQSRVGFDGPLMVVLTDRGIVEARPSAVRAETHILVRGDDVQNQDDAAAQTTYHNSESSGGHADTTTEAYPAVTASGTSSEGSRTAVTSLLQLILEDKAIPATGTAISSRDTTLLPDISLNSVASGNEWSGSQRRILNSVPATELDNSILYTATETLIPTAQGSESEHVSESMSTKDRRVSAEEPRTVTEGNKHIVTQILYTDGLQLASGTQSPLAEGETELSKNALQVPEMSNEIPVTIRTEMSADETVATLPGQTLTPSWKHDDTIIQHTAGTVPERSPGESGRVPVLSKQDTSGCDENGEPTSAECDTAVSLQPTEGFSAAQTFDELLNTQGTQTLVEISTLLSNIETTVFDSEPTAEQLHQLRSGATPPTTVDSEIVVAPEGITDGNSSPTGAAGTSDPPIAPSSAPSVGAAAQESAQYPPLCGDETAGRPFGTQCWLVQFVGAKSSSPVCVGSYLDATTIVTSATCISRMLDVGAAQMTMVSAGGAVTSHTQIRDMAVHEEYRQHGAWLILNDIGLLRMRPASPMPPAACALCLPRSDLDLLNRSCDGTTLGQVKPKSVERDPQIGSPLVCRGGVLAGIASYYNPGPVYTPVSDYVSWIETNQKMRDNQDDAWK